MHTLSDAIEALYQAFAVMPKPKHIDGCPCCIDRKETGVLLGKALRTITPEEMASYASSAFLTVGEVADYLYFLPRIIEITATEPSWWPDPEVTGRAMLTDLTAMGKVASRTPVPEPEFFEEVRRLID